MLSQEIDSNIILNYNRSLPQIYTKIILKGIEQKEFKTSLNVEYITRQLMISIRGIIFEWLLSYNKFDLKNEIINYFKFIIDGLKIKLISSRFDILLVKHNEHYEIEESINKVCKFYDIDI